MSLVFTYFTKSWCGNAAGKNTLRNSLLHGCDNCESSSNLLEWSKHRKVTQETGLKPDIVFLSNTTRQIILVDVTVPYESRMEQANIIISKRKIQDSSKELEKAGYYVYIVLNH
ncbi:reverse transcriptase [Plakobranchus ocellatus]|uniref:Reverse transcriptase n=1 Tax=Plakobranchus ocellatus TaxID=259542 RepID=A0AAV4DSS3_9GAST|nr:reverse transcriptase [Plakobranchus ocellatus]